jgi:hypothetical protein
MNPFLASTTAFGIFATLGPLVRWASWLTSSAYQSLNEFLHGFISDLIFLLWPAGLVAVMEVTPGRIAAASYAIGANIAFFIAIGLLAATAARRRTALFSLYLVMSVLVCFLALWGAGFSLAFLNAFALGSALLLYAAPFLAVHKLSAPRRRFGPR